VNDGDQPVAILAEIEDYISIHVIGILKDLPHFQEIPPSYLIGDPEPGPNFPGGIWELLFGLD
jgi:hypothetical protein